MTAACVCVLAGVLTVVDQGWIGWGVAVPVGIATGIIGYVVGPVALLVAAGYLVAACVEPLRS